jgi:GNAT superfamily N-acetyltransferase
MNVITTAIPGDLGSLSLLFDLYRQFYRQPPDLNGAHAFLSDRLAKQDSMIYVAKQDGAYTGFVQCYPLFSSVGMKRLWLLNDLFVKEDFRGQGISKLLISRCKQLAADTHAKGLMLETEKANVVGNRLYPSAGFVLIEGSNFYIWTA